MRWLVVMLVRMWVIMSLKWDHIYGIWIAHFMMERAAVIRAIICVGSWTEGISVIHRVAVGLRVLRNWIAHPIAYSMAANKKKKKT